MSDQNSPAVSKAIQDLSDILKREQDIEAMLSNLAYLVHHIEGLRIEQQKRLDEVTPPEVQELRQQVMQAMLPVISSAEQDIDRLKSAIKEAVTAHGQTVGTDSFLAVYSPGRVSWDDDGLMGFAIALPAIKELRSVGKPSCAIRPVEPKKKK